MRPDRDTLYRLYLTERLSTGVIGERYSVPRITVNRWLRSYDIPLRPKGRGLDNRGLVAPTKEELYDLVHVQHLSYVEIGQRYGVDNTAVTHWIRKHKIESPLVWDTRRKGVPTVLPTADELRTLYAAGYSLASIGRRFGLSAHPIRRLCDEYGISVHEPRCWNRHGLMLCSDGHRVRSEYEMRVDDWLSEHGIEHVYEPRVPFDRRSRADFYANGWYIEVWGIRDDADPAYAKRRKRKTELYRAYGLPLIEITAQNFHAHHKGLWKRRLLKVLDVALLDSSLDMFGDIRLE